MIVDTTQTKTERHLTPKVEVTAFSSEEDFVKHVSKCHKCLVVLYDPIDGNTVFMTDNFTCWNVDEGPFVDFSDTDHYTLPLDDVLSIIDRGKAFYCRSDETWVMCTLDNLRMIAKGGER